MTYIVRVYDNFHYMDEEEAYDLPPFEDAEKALEECRACVDRSLDNEDTAGMTTGALYDQYLMFGDDPVLIAVGSPAVKFSAWEYALQRCAELCGASPAANG